MSDYRGLVFCRRADRLALVGLRMGLAAVFVSLGLGFLMLPRLTADLPRLGDGANYPLLLGVSHLAVGIALLAPPLGDGTRFLIGSLVIWFTMRSLPLDEALLPVGPLLLTLALLLLAVGYRLRRRADTMAWLSLLDRYAGE